MALRETYSKGLEAFGYRREATASKKYWLYTNPGASPTYFWLGKAGAVRYGNINRIDASLPASEKTKVTLINAASEL